MNARIEIGSVERLNKREYKSGIEKGGGGHLLSASTSELKAAIYSSSSMSLLSFEGY
jgi:hypothetical protein